MISNDMFLVILFCFLVLVSPLLALIERLLLGLGILLISFCLGIILLSSPILLVSGVFLILASEATVSSGLYYITFSILSPIILLPLFLYMSELSDSDQLMEGKFSLILLNLFVILVSLIVFGSSSIYFLGVLVAASVLTLGDLVMNKWTTNNW
jgi:hypothetical protein